MSRPKSVDARRCRSHQLEFDEGARMKCYNETGSKRQCITCHFSIILVGKCSIPRRLFVFFIKQIVNQSVQVAPSDWADLPPSTWTNQINSTTNSNRAMDIAKMQLAGASTKFLFQKCRFNRKYGHELDETNNWCQATVAPPSPPPSPCISHWPAPLWAHTRRLVN